MIKKISFFLYLSFFTFSTFAQKNYPQNYFISPIDIPINLSGTFGELREDHFHSGMDIRTGEVEGLKVHAVADGYVSRIKIAPDGYGNALYITHNNGYVSVYGHLQRYNKTIGDYVKKEQYKLESFEVDLYPDKGLLPVKQGDVVALTGNTGSSGGPHLHFEIRDEATQETINPLLFGFKIQDSTSPVINMIKVYPVGDGSQIDHKTTESEYFTKNNGKSYSLSKMDTLIISGKVYFGINTYDPFNSGNNKNGVYSIRLLVDSTQVYEQDVERFAFDETRYINSLIDYKEFILNNRRVQKSYIQPNNHLTIYKNTIHKGVVQFDDDALHTVRYDVSDAAGNVSELRFHVLSRNFNTDTAYISNQKESEGELFTYTSDNTFKTEDLVLNVPGAALYDTLYFRYQLKPALKKSFSKVHQLDYDYVPLHTWCSLSIRPDSLPARLQNKSVIVKIGKDGKITSTGGEWNNGFVTTNIREFGDYCIMADTVKPEIKPVNFTPGKTLSSQNNLKVMITDELSGIKSYRGTLNGQWILMDYDEKNDLLIYNFDDRIKKGTNDLVITVSDNKNNVSSYKAKLVY